MQELKGIISAFITPMHSNEEINEAELINQVERQIAAGAAGAISAVTNILPEMVYSIYRGFVSGDLAAAQAAQEGIQPIRDCFKLGNPNTVVKRAVEQMGYPVGKPRRPFCGLSAAADDAITDTIVRCYSQYFRR